MGMGVRGIIGIWEVGGVRFEDLFPPGRRYVVR